MKNEPDIRWELLDFAALDVGRLYAILKARADVFITEQKCPYGEVDGLDQQCHHLVGWGAPQEVAAYLRIVPPGMKYNEPSLGRVVTTVPYRGKGLGRELTKRGVEESSKLYPGQPVRISAQAYLEKFYGDFGFQRISGPYDEDGIPHIEMLLAGNK